LEQQRDFAEYILSNMGQGVSVTDRDGDLNTSIPLMVYCWGGIPKRFLG
jgi:pantothenate kinase